MEVEIKKKRKYTPRVTGKIKKLVHLNIENCKRKKPLPLYKLTTEAGYSSKTNPYKLEHSVPYKEYFQQIIKDTDLTRLHRGLMEARSFGRDYFPVEFSDEEIIDIVEQGENKVKSIKIADIPFQGVKKVCYYSFPLNEVRDRALDKAYKVVGGYAPEKKEVKTFDMAKLHEQVFGDKTE